MSKFEWNFNDIKLPDNFLVITTVEVVIFPKMVVPLLVVDKNIINELTNPAKKIDKVVLLAAQNPPKEGEARQITKSDLYKVGTICKIIRLIQLQDDTLKIVLQGVARTNVESLSEIADCLFGHCSEFKFSLDGLPTNRYNEIVKEFLQIADKSKNNQAQNQNSFGSDFQFIAAQIQDPERLVDFVIGNISIDTDVTQKLLEKTNIVELLECTKDIFKNYLEKSAIREDVRTSARNSINKSQREYFLREQLRAIKKELGEQEDCEYDDIKKKVRETALSAEAREECRRQLRRLEKMSPDSLEAVVIKNHLEWIVNLPWNTFVNDKTIDLKKAKELLDKEHFGMKSIKEKILDHLSIRSFKEKYNSQILCLNGAPGVGKTSIAKSIAAALGRKFVRISIGGVHDEAELRGHRKTYVGAMPGRIIQSIRKAESCNPVILIDEIDKIGTSGKGDPAAALLEILDYEQNHTFYDNFLGVSFDISNVMFIATCNDLSAIPGPLRDRLDIINLAGYSSSEKVNIAKNHLIPKISESMGLSKLGIQIEDNVLNEVIQSYTRESGVRELERVIGKLFAKYARSVVEKGSGIQYTHDILEELLGHKHSRYNTFQFSDKIGVANGLAWTSAGGEVLQVESVLMPGTGKLTLTGQLGDVMKESSLAAISYARAHAAKYNIEEKLFTTTDLHIHLPAGGIPKDGPSAGITLLSSILSALTKRAVDAKCAMTGELNLQGQVMPIGGVKEKLLAAQYYGLKTVFVPEYNRKDLEDAENWIDLSGIELLFIRNVEELLNRVLL